MGLDEVVVRLSRSAEVDGVLLVGSAGRGALTPESDYDLLIVLNELPPTLQVGVTTIDHRLTDLLFASAAQIDAIVSAAGPLDGAAWEGRIVRWLPDGRVAHDRRGQLRAAQEKVRAGGWVRALQPTDAYGAWIGVSYNLLHTRRLLKSSDPVYRAAGELRITLYGIPSVLYSYFQVRGLLWDGDKAAVRHLMAHDPAYADLLMQALREPDPDQKLALYERLGAESLAPIGGLWQPETTVLWSDAVAASLESIDQGLALWEGLLGTPAQG
jgi:predicted nucleotidyltransferase